MNIAESQVLKGSSALYTALFQEFEDRKPEGGWNKHDRHDHSPEQIQWLLDHGCEYHKVTAEPGDLLLWDSVSQDNWLTARCQNQQHSEPSIMELLLRRITPG